MLLLDGFFVWKEKSIAQSQPFQVEIHPYLDAHEPGHVWGELDNKEDAFLTASHLSTSAITHLDHRIMNH